MKTKNNKKIKTKVEKVTEAFKSLSSIDLVDILKKYEEKQIEVISDGLKFNHACYNKDTKMVIVDKEFISANRDDDELAYILLHEYFHVVENEEGAFSKVKDSEGLADIYAILVFEKNNKEVPPRFTF